MAKVLARTAEAGRSQSSSGSWILLAVGVAVATVMAISMPRLVGREGWLTGEKFLYLALIAYLGAAVLYAFAAGLGYRALQAGARALTRGGFLLHTTAIAVRWAGAGHAPLSNIYEMVLVFSWGVVALQELSEWKFDLPYLGAITVPIAALALILMQVLPGEIRPLVPALQSTWLQVHVTLAMLSYAGFTISFAVALLYLIKDGVTARGFLSWNAALVLGVYATIVATSVNGAVALTLPAWDAAAREKILLAPRQPLLVPLAALGWPFVAVLGLAALTLVLLAVARTPSPGPALRDHPLPQGGEGSNSTPACPFPQGDEGANSTSSFPFTQGGEGANSTSASPLPQVEARTNSGSVSPRPLTPCPPPVSPDERGEGAYPISVSPRPLTSNPFPLSPGERGEGEGSGVRGLGSNSGSRSRWENLARRAGLATLFAQALALALLLVKVTGGPYYVPEYRQSFGVHLAASPFLLAGVVTALFASLAWEVLHWKYEVIARRLPSRDTLDELIYKTVAISFPLLTLMIIAGAYWANRTWGSYWSWDPKEDWALITWLTYAAYLHMRLTRGWRGRRSAYFAIIGFAVVMFTFFGVTYLLPGLHAYA